MDLAGKQPVSEPEALLQQTDRLQTLNEISRVVSGTLDLRTLYDTIYEQVGRVMDTSQFFIALRSIDGTTMDIPYLREEGKLFLDMEYPYENTVTTRIIDNGLPFLFHNPEEFDEYARQNGLPELIVGDEDSESGIFVPLNTGRRTIGAMTVQSQRRQAYSQDDVQTLSVIASQAAVAIENARLYQQSQDSVRQMQALLHVAQIINGSLNVQAVLDAILAGMREVVPYYFAAILLPDHSKGHLNVAAALGPPERSLQTEELREAMNIPFGEGVTGTVFQSGEPLNVPDVSEFAGYIDHGGKILSEMSIPLRRGDTVVGVLDVERAEAHGFSSNDLGLLSLFASQAAIAIENARLYSEQQKRVYELAAIQSVVQKLTPLHDVPSIAAVINQELKLLIDYHSCRVFVLDHDEHLLIPISQANFDPEGLRLKLGEGITGSIAALGRSEIIHNMADDPRGWHIPGTPHRSESMIGAPLIYEGRVRGVITLTKLGTNQFDENALRLLEIIAAQAAIAFDRARLYDELRTEAVTDELTKLYNRRYLLERFREEQSRAVRNRHNLASIMLDIDKFKAVNDRYGHDAGDVVLHQLGSVIRPLVRAEDIVSRWGGEEFCILLPEIPLSDVEQVAERLRAAIEEYVFPDSAGVSHITVSVGMSFLLTDDEGPELFTRADQAMYAVKRRGGNQVCLSTVDDFLFYDQHDDLRPAVLEGRA